MIRLAAAALVLLAAGPQDKPEADQLAAAIQVVVRHQMIVRVPQGGVPASSTPVHWREGDGPRCVAAGQIAGAVPSQNSVDFVMRDRSRIRARLGRRCAALDYYRGFYLNPTEDGRICADRDVVRSRMGGECTIAEFRTLQPVRR